MPPKRRRRFHGLYYHASPPRIVPMNGSHMTTIERKRKREMEDFSVKLSTIRIWMHEKDIGKLTRILWAGQGNRLSQQASTNPKVKRFLTAVPYVMNSIKDVHQAVIDNSLETLQAKLEPPTPPALVTCRDANGLNLIHKAAGLGHATILEYLISIWPDGVHETDITGKTPLHWAASAKNNSRCYTLLTKAGCDEEARDYKMKTPIYYRHKPHDIERAFLTYVPEAPRVSPGVATDWEALSDDAGDGKKPDIRIKELNGFGRQSNAESNENTSEADLTEEGGTTTQDEEERMPDKEIVQPNSQIIEETNEHHNKEEVNGEYSRPEIKDTDLVAENSEQISGLNESQIEEVAEENVQKEDKSEQKEEEEEVKKDNEQEEEEVKKDDEQEAAEHHKEERVSEENANGEKEDEFPNYNNENINSNNTTIVEKKEAIGINDSEMLKDTVQAEGEENDEGTDDFKVNRVEKKDDKPKGLYNNEKETSDANEDNTEEDVVDNLKESSPEKNHKSEQPSEDEETVREENEGSSEEKNHKVEVEALEPSEDDEKFNEEDEDISTEKNHKDDKEKFSEEDEENDLKDEEETKETNEDDEQYNEEGEEKTRKSVEVDKELNEGEEKYSEEYKEKLEQLEKQHNLNSYGGTYANKRNENSKESEESEEEQNKEKASNSPDYNLNENNTKKSSKTSNKSFHHKTNKNYNIIENTEDPNNNYTILEEHNNDLKQKEEEVLKEYDELHNVVKADTEDEAENDEKEVKEEKNGEYDENATSNFIEAKVEQVKDFVSELKDKVEDGIKRVIASSGSKEEEGEQNSESEEHATTNGIILHRIDSPPADSKTKNDKDLLGLERVEKENADEEDEDLENIQDKKRKVKKDRNRSRTGRGKQKYDDDDEEEEKKKESEEKEKEVADENEEDESEKENAKEEERKYKQKNKDKEIVLLRQRSFTMKTIENGNHSVDSEDNANTRDRMAHKALRTRYKGPVSSSDSEDDLIQYGRL